MNTKRRNSIQHRELARWSLQRVLQQKDGGSLLAVVEAWVILHQGRNVVSVPVYSHDVFSVRTFNDRNMAAVDNDARWCLASGTSRRGVPLLG